MKPPPAKKRKQSNGMEGSLSVSGSQPPHVGGLQTATAGSLNSTKPSPAQEVMQTGNSFSKDASSGALVPGGGGGGGGSETNSKLSGMLVSEGPSSQQTSKEPKEPPVLPDKLPATVRTKVANLEQVGVILHVQTCRCN